MKTKSGQATDDNLKPNWKYFELMKFCERSLLSRKAKESITNTKTKQLDSNSEKNPEDIENETEAAQNWDNIDGILQETARDKYDYEAEFEPQPGTSTSTLSMEVDPSSPISESLHFGESSTNFSQDQESQQYGNQNRTELDDSDAEPRVIHRKRLRKRSADLRGD
jgi:hypothetical protein